MYECLTGELTYDADDKETLLRKRSMEDAPPPSRTALGRWIPPALDELVLAMTARDRERRPATMAAVIDRWLEVQPAFDEAWALQHLVARPFRVSALAPAAIGGCVGEDGEPAPQVLVVDDQFGIRSLIRRVLQRVGLTCATAGSVTEALQRIVGRPQPQAVVMDVLMPDVGGLEALGHLRDAGYVGRVIVCSSLESPPVRASAVQRGADAHLVKGRDLTRLPEVLKSLGVVPGRVADQAPRW
jgi:CheY-like chemotaxis protein